MIVGICGLAGSGKDTTADFLVKNNNFVKVALADPLKRICRDAFAFTDDQLWGPSSSRNAPDKRYIQMKKGALGSQQTLQEYDEKHGFKTVPCPEEDIYLTPRYALQKLGTEWGRDCYGNVWVDYALRVAKTLLEDPNFNYLYSQKLGVHDRQPHVRSQGRPYSGVVISDVRFRNEIDAIHACGGIVIRMMRGSGLEGAAAHHVSETEQQSIDDSELDHIIDNREYSLEQLEAHVLSLSQKNFQKDAP